MPQRAPGGGDRTPLSGDGPPRSRRRVPWPQWFSSPVGAPVRRRPTDVLLLAAALVALVLVALAAPGPTQVDSGLAEAAAGLPDVVAWVFHLAYTLAVLWAVTLLAVSLLARGRRGVAAGMLLASGVALGLAGVVGALAGTGWDRSFAALWSVDPPPVYTAVRVAVVTAVLVTASPHLARPVRTVGRLLLTAMATAAVLLGVSYPIGAVAGFLVGVIAGSATHLLVGSPGGRPTVERVRAALADLGLDARVSDAQQYAGATLFEATVAGRPPLQVTVLGRDEWDAQTLGAAWTAATRRGTRVRLGVTRQARVEHAAMVSLLAERAGVRVPGVVVAGRSDEGDALLVTQRAGRALAGLDDVDDAWLDDAWGQLGTLADAGIALGAVDGQHLAVDEHGRAVLVPTGDAVVGADDAAMRSDEVRMLTATALVAGPDRAVAAVRRARGDEGLVPLLPYLQPAVLDTGTRRRLRGLDWDVASLRDRVVADTGVEPPPLEQVSRVSRGALLRVALIAVLAYVLISSLAGVDLSSIWQELSSADWAWLAAALVVSPVAQVFYAFSTLGATTVSLRYLPVLMLQYAVQFLALVVPSTGARIALDVRFYQSFGIAGGAAVAMGMIDSFSGFVVQILLLAVILLSGLPGFTSPVVGSSTSDTAGSTGGSSSPSLLALTLALALASLVVAVVVPRLRHRLAGAVRRGMTALREQARAGRGALQVLRRPGKAAQMLMGNLGAQVVQAVVLGLCLHAFGSTAHLSQLILINTAVSLFAGLMPVPGGMGVAEAGYTAGLQAIGVPSAVAISTAIAFRLVTFYLPPLWGSLAMRWLRRHSYV